MRPVWTDTPAAARRSRPRPLAKGEGSSQATTTRLTLPAPAARRRTARRWTGAAGLQGHVGAAPRPPRPRRRAPAPRHGAAAGAVAASAITALLDQHAADNGVRLGEGRVRPGEAIRPGMNTSSASALTPRAGKRAGGPALVEIGARRSGEGPAPGSISSGLPVGISTRHDGLLGRPPNRCLTMPRSGVARGRRSATSRPPPPWGRSRCPVGSTRSRVVFRLSGFGIGRAGVARVGGEVVLAAGSMGGGGMSNERAPDLHLLVAVARRRLRLVQPGEPAVVALVQPPILHRGHVGWPAARAPAAGADRPL
jgi:hypothetical protein